MQSAPDVNLLLPTPNVFIPTDFSLKDLKDKVQFHHSSYNLQLSFKF